MKKGWVGRWAGGGEKEMKDSNKFCPYTKILKQKFIYLGQYLDWTYPFFFPFKKV